MSSGGARQKRARRKHKLRQAVDLAFRDATRKRRPKHRKPIACRPGVIWPTKSITEAQVLTIEANRDWRTGETEANVRKSTLTPLQKLMIGLD